MQQLQKHLSENPAGDVRIKTGNAEGLSRNNFLEHTFFPSYHRVDGNRSGEERPIKA